jgi:hypothetical protein
MGSPNEFARLVANALNQIINGYPFQQFDTAPAAPDAGFTYYDTVLGKVRTWDGAAWNNHF